MKKLSLLFLLFITGCSSNINNISDNSFLDRQIAKIRSCIQNNIELSLKEKNLEISRIYQSCKGLTDTYDHYVLIGKSNSFTYEYLSNQRTRWYQEINSQIAKFNSNITKGNIDSISQKRSPLYFFSQLKGSLVILNNSFKYCDFSNASKLDFNDTLAKYIDVINFTNQLIELDLTIKSPNLKNYIIEFDNKALKILEAHIQNSFTINKESTCLNVKNQLLGNDRKIIDLIRQTIDSIDSNLLENAKVKVALQMVKNALANLEKSFDKNKV